MRVQDILDILDALSPRSTNEIETNAQLKEIITLVGAEGAVNPEFRNSIISKAAMLSASHSQSDQIKAYLLLLPFFQTYPDAKRVMDTLIGTMSAQHRLAGSERASDKRGRVTCLLIIAILAILPIGMSLACYFVFESTAGTVVACLTIAATMIIGFTIYGLWHEELDSHFKE